MPFCPKCRYEYEVQVSICPDCGERLVSQLLPKADNATADNEEDDYSKYDDWIHLARLTSSQTADMIEEILHSKDIPAVILSGAGHFGITGQLGMSSFRPIDGAYSLMVPREFVVDADREAEIVLGDDWKKVRLVNID